MMKKKSRRAIARDAFEACQIGIELMESDGIWSLDHATAGIARQKQSCVSIMLDGARIFRVNEGGRWWVTSKKADGC